MKLDKKHENRLEFVADVSTTFANMLRRYVISRVPVLAIDSVTFYDNTSPVWDEYVSHRLGLVPLVTPENTPASAEIVFSLDSEGPKVAYTSEMKSSDKEIVAAKNIPIITLAANQHLRFEAKAVLGTAQKHAKFQAGIMSYGQEGKQIRFMVESFYQMTPADVVERSCDLIESDIDAIEDLLGEKKPKKEKETKPKKERKKKEE